ncbi:transposase [Nocardia grenadensis]
MVPKSFPQSVRRQVCARLRAGEPIAEIAAETGISPATLFRWKTQVLVDAGVREGVPSVEADELAAAKKRIARLEAELKLTREGRCSGGYLDNIRLRPDSRGPKSGGRVVTRTKHTYCYTGPLFHRACGRRMQGTWNHDRAHYRCRYPSEYALANDLDHPPSVYLREDGPAARSGDRFGHSA